MTPMLPSPFIVDPIHAAPVPVQHVSHPQDYRFVLDEALFMKVIAPKAVDRCEPSDGALPVFLRDPSPDYLFAVEPSPRGFRDLALRKLMELVQ